MTCPNCGAQNDTSNRFCWECGRSLEAPCETCGALNPPGKPFCGTCGSALPGTVATVDPAATPRTGDVTERRLITVLFADLTNYTTFSEGRDPEDVRAFLTTYFDRSSEVIGRFGGIVEKFIGDAVMAVWGATQANEDDAERAVRAGLELVDTIAKVAADAGANLTLRVGIHTGDASVGPGGRQIAMVAGDNVNIAARLQTAASPGTVLVGAGTYQAAQQAIEFEPAGEHEVKGKAQRVVAYQAIRVVAERRGVGRSDQLEPPFVGRREELRLLKDLLGSVGRDTRARMVSVIGETGMGKSRLVWEFQKYIDGLVDDVFWHEGRSLAYREGVTFWAVAEMIRTRAGIADDDTDEVTRAKLQAALDEHLTDPGDRDWAMPRLAAVLGVGTAPEGERSELDAAVRVFFEGVTAKGTTVLVFEDAHWADAALLDFIDELPEWWSGVPILVVAVARPELTEQRPAWSADRPGTITVHLGPLSRPEMVELVNGTTPGLPEDAVAAVVDKAAGVPLYGVELLRMLIARGDIVPSGAGYQLVGDLPDEAVPDSLQAVIGARLDRLGPDERALLQDAAVLGQTFSVAGLAAIDAAGGDTHPARLAQLVRRELIEPVRDPRSPQHGQYRFIQSMIRDVALGRMSRDTRRARHLEVAAFHEQLADPELAVVVASHYLEALDATPAGTEADAIRAKALGSMAAAADRAADLRAHSQVMSISSQALALADTPDLRVPFWERLAEAANKLALREESVRYGRLVLDHARGSADRHAVTRAVRILATIYADEWLPQEALALLEPHLAEHPDLDEDPELVRAAALLARVLLLVEADEASSIVTAADRAIHAAELSGLTDVLVDALITKATATRRAGRTGGGTHPARGSHGPGRPPRPRVLRSPEPQQPGPPVRRTRPAGGAADDPRGIRPHGARRQPRLGALRQFRSVVHLPADARPRCHRALAGRAHPRRPARQHGQCRARATRVPGVGTRRHRPGGGTARRGRPTSSTARRIPSSPHCAANLLATISRLSGNAEEAFASAVAWGGEGWSQFLGLDNALWCVAILGDRERAAGLLDLIEQIPRPGPRLARRARFHRGHSAGRAPAGRRHRRDGREVRRQPHGAVVDPGALHGGHVLAARAP